jgi:hypothetical protein
MRMTMYDDFILEIATFMVEAGIATSSTLLGCTEREIEELQSSHPGKLPASFTAFLRKMGYSAGEFMQDCAIGINTWDENHQVADALTADPRCQWRFANTILPISQYQTFQLLFIDASQGDDPEVLHYMEGHSRPVVVGPTFTSWLRECVLGDVESKPWNDEICREIWEHRENWMERKRVIDHYEAQVNAMRSELVQRVAAADVKRGRITGPLQFQALWNREIEATDIYQTLLQERKRVPWGWLSLEDAIRLPGEAT